MRSSFELSEFNFVFSRAFSPPKKKMSQKPFVQLLLGSKTFRATGVSTKGCQNVDEFIEEIQKKFSPLLDSYSAAQLTLYEAEGTSVIDPETDIEELFVTKGKPLIVKVEEIQSQKPIIINRCVLPKNVKEGPNQGRFFYDCPQKLCGFFEWQDQDKSGPSSYHHTSQPPPPPSHNPGPNCGCGVSSGLYKTVKEGPNQGRFVYA